MTLVFDTSILIDIERKSESTLEQLQKLAKIYPSPAKITFITMFEFILGIQERLPRNKEVARAFLENFSILQTTTETAKILATLKHKYDRAGKTFPLADLLIASLVIENRMILLTRDKDFKAIEELTSIILHQPQQ